MQLGTTAVGPRAGLATALVAAGAGGLWLRLRHRHYERLAVESAGEDDDAAPEVSPQPVRGAD